MVRIIVTILRVYRRAYLGKVYIPMLHALKAGQSIREIGPKWHSSKNGTPTIGGIIFITAMLVCVFAGIGNQGRGLYAPAGAGLCVGIRRHRLY